MRSLSTISRTTLLAGLASAALAAGAQTSPSTPAQGGVADRTAVESAFTRIDANKDGKVTKDEVTKMPALSAKFAELDKDKDGGLNMVEFAAAYAKN
jgi:EF hand